MSKKKDCVKIIEDFFKSANTRYGYGFFEFERPWRKHSDLDVVDYAMETSKSQRRKYERYGVIPIAFFLYLKEMGLLIDVHEIPQGSRRTIKDLLELLYNGSYQSDSARDYGLYMREQILEDLCPDMHVMFGIGEKLGKDLHKFRHGLPLKNNTKIKTLWNIAAR